VRLMCERAATLLLVVASSVGCGGNQSESSHWAGKTFLLEFPAKHWNQPANKNVAQAVGDFVPQFLVSVSASGGSENVTIATAKAGVQDKANGTQQTTLSRSSFPDSEFVISEFPINCERTDSNTGETAKICATIRNLTFTNILPGADDTARTDGKFKATGNMEGLAPLFFLQKDPTADSICTMLASDQYETPCETCSFNNQQHCLTIGATQIGAKSVSASVEQVSVSDSAASCL
jgi:hypothetical protein